MSSHKGANGSIHVERDAVVFSREGMAARNAFGKDVPPRRVPLSEITGVVHKPAGKLANGHFQLLRNRQQAPAAAPGKDPDGLQYTPQKSAEFQQLVTWLQSVAEKNNPGAAVAAAAGPTGLSPVQDRAWYQKRGSQLAAAGLFGLLLGSCGGGGGDDALKTLRAERVSAEQQVEQMQEQSAEAERELADTRKRIADLEAEVKKARDAEAAAAAEAKAASEAAAAAAVPPPAAEPEPEPVAKAPVPVSEPAPAEAYYANCAEARSAGAAPIRSGEPGYRKGLDRDGDGIACDK